MSSIWFCLACFALAAIAIVASVALQSRDRFSCPVCARRQAAEVTERLKRARELGYRVYEPVEDVMEKQP
jgi:hypothetical protein